MSFAHEQRAVFGISARLSLWYALFFVLTVAGLYVVSNRLIDSALDEEWGFSQQQVEQTPNRDGRGYRLTIREQRGRARPPVAMRERIDRHFRDAFLWLALPITLLGLIGGAALTYHIARPVRHVMQAVSHILATGELSKRVAEDSSSGDLAPLFNRMLAQIESLVRAQRDSLDNVAHDLRTPLARLRATAERAASHPDDVEASREAIADVMEESERLVRMVDTLMDVAEAESGTMRLQTAVVSVPDLVRDVIDLYEMVAEEKQVQLRAELPEHLEIECDGDRLRQVLANLVDNAIKYSDGPSGVTVTGRGDPGWVEIAVADHGHGIASDDLPRIWDRLYRADRSRSKRGLGLGLNYVRAVVEAHGGTVTVDSALDRGSTFTVRLPR